jgi:hypothetical protein
MFGRFRGGQMSDIPSRSKSNSTSPLLGGAVGAMIGGVGRFLVAVSFVYYMQWGKQGGPQAPGGVSFFDVLFSVFSGQKGSSIFFISASLGVVVGGIAGSTCRPILGAAIGAGLSGLFCTFLVVLPWTLAFQLFPIPNRDDSALKTTITVGLLAMILVGAIAGGLGAAAGKWGRIKAELATTADRP